MVAAYQNGDAAYPPMLAAIEAARPVFGLVAGTSPGMTFRGGRFIEALAGATGAASRARAHRRYRRRLDLPRAYCRYAAKASRPPGSCIRCYRGACLSVNLRTHKKLLVTDGASDLPAA